VLLSRRFQHGDGLKRIVYKNEFTRSESKAFLLGDEKRCEGTTHPRAVNEGGLRVTKNLSMEVQEEVF
jgi:hypothetical protein